MSGAPTSRRTEEESSEQCCGASRTATRCDTALTVRTEGIKREDVIAQMRKLDPRMEIEQTALVRPAGGFRPKLM